MTAARVVIGYPAALLAVMLALAQVAAPDLAVWVVAKVRGGRPLLRAVGRRLRPWSSEVGPRRGLQTWLVVLLVFTACNLASGLLHRAIVPGHLEWHLTWTTLALLPVAMFLDAGALLEENGWRGFALPVLLRSHGPLVASLIVGLAWATWHFPVKFDVFLDYGWAGALIYLSAFSLKIVAISVVMTYFWARAGQATLLAIAMHGLSNDVARVGGLVDGSTWHVDALSEVNLAVPSSWSHASSCRGRTATAGATYAASEPVVRPAPSCRRPSCRHSAPDLSTRTDSHVEAERKRGQLVVVGHR